MIFRLLNIWDSKGVFFVVRLKENLQYVIIKENELPENRHQHILKDEIIELKSEISKTKYSKNKEEYVKPPTKSIQGVLF